MLRLIDANLDRLGEGLRVLEDVARFLLDERVLSRRLKRLRHRLGKVTRPLEYDLLAARRVSEDVGALARSPGDLKHGDLPALVRANARRVEESLRVLEESARLAGTPLHTRASEFERLRFEVYDLEKELVSLLARREKRGGLAGLYLVLDVESLRGRDAVEVAVLAIRGGAGVIQLRDKWSGKSELLETARKLRKACSENGVLFIVNDYLDIALACGADGLHLGQEDLPVSEARRLLPLDRLVGCSTRTVAQAMRAQAAGADYVAVGSIYPARSKAEFRLVGLEALRRIRGRVSLPVIAIGGIDIGNAEEVMRAGADGLAVVSAVLGAEDIEGAARDLASRLAQLSLEERENGEKHR